MAIDFDALNQGAFHDGDVGNNYVIVGFQDLANLQPLVAPCREAMFQDVSYGIYRKVFGSHSRFTWPLQ